METSTVITADGPYVHVLLRDVLPPDWDALGRELDRELDDGARRVTFALSRTSGISPDDPGLLHLTDRLRASGVVTAIVS